MRNNTKKRLQTGRLATDPQPGMKLLEAIRTRRTVRSYQDKTVPIEVVKDILIECTHAPNACNRKGWRFIVINNPKELDWLYRKGSAAFVNKTKQAILACYLSRTDNDAWRDVEQSASASITYFQLLAHTMGIGSCWVCHLPPKREVCEHFGIPKGYTPIALITFGYYKPDLTISPRIPDPENKVSINRWAFETGNDEQNKGCVFLLKKFARKMYYLFPKREWLRDATDKFEKKFNNEGCEDKSSCNKK